MRETIEYEPSRSLNRNSTIFWKSFPVGCLRIFWEMRYWKSFSIKKVTRELIESSWNAPEEMGRGSARFEAKAPFPNMLDRLRRLRVNDIKGLPL